MKKILILAILVLTLTSLSAIPAKRTAITLTQGDGSVVQVRLVGDEHFHYYQTEEGLPVEFDEQQMLRPISYESLRVRQEIASQRRAMIQKAREERLMANSPRFAHKTSGQQRIGEFGNMIGEKKGLILLVNYTDKAMYSTHNQAAFNDMFNLQGYSQGGHQGSVADFFREQSYGLFNLQFDVVGPLTLSHNLNYYGQNSMGNNDAHPGEMVIEALTMADSLVNYADYDWDGDGEVEQVFVVYAGYGEAQGAASNTIWPHEWNLSSAAYYGDGTGAQYLDGVTIDTYACSCELQGSWGSTLNGIGTACHEFSHCLGYPDLYDTDYSGAFGMGDWDLMDAGSYNGPSSGEVPCGFSSYERWMAGWLEPIEINEAGYVTDMPSVADTAVAYILYNERVPNEYYLLENRQSSDKWFQYCGGHGMLVIHVDYDANVWANNSVNDSPSHQRMTIIPADNTQSSYSLSGDPFPGTSNKTELTNTSTPAAKLYNTNLDGSRFMNKPITEIVEVNGKISFTAMGGLEIPKPKALVLSEDSTTLTLTWPAVTIADSYKVKLTTTSYANQTMATIVSEDMSKFVRSSDGSTPLDDKLDQYFTTPGWKGSNVYCGKLGAKLGTSTKRGNLISPALAVGGELKVHLLVQAYSTSGTQSATVYLLDESLNVVESHKVPYSSNLQTFAFEKPAAENYHVKIAPSSRAYVGKIIIEGLTAGERMEEEFGDITDTCFVVNSILPDTRYDFRVCSVKGDNISQWSDLLSFKLEEIQPEDPDNPDNPDDPNVDAIDQLLQNNNEKVQSYDLMGRPVKDNRYGISVRNGQLTIIVK